MVSELHDKLTVFKDVMLELTVFLKNDTGKDEEAIKKEKIQRLNSASELAGDFYSFYDKNKIYLDQKTCDLIENIHSKYKDSHTTLSCFFKYPGSNFSQDLFNTARRIVRNDVPPLINQLEEKLRNTMDE